MKIEIGGYFELELQKGEEYHKNAIRLNTGRNALELILRIKQYKKVFIPYYTCDVILEPFHKLKIDYEFYYIDENFEPLFNYNIIKENEGFLYTNYFGLKDSFISNLSAICRNLIVDNAQAFFSLPLKGIPTFYSCRKFFGVPDGAYLYIEGVIEFDFPLDSSLERFEHLLKRIEFGAEAGYNDFKTNENRLKGQPIKQMSKLTKALMCGIDYEFVQKKRRKNFAFMHKQFSIYNNLKLNLDSFSIPMVYPFLLQKTNIKQQLISNKIYVAAYWTNVLELTNKESIENKYSSQIIPLPIDQRYCLEELKNIVKQLKLNYYEY